MKIKSIEIQRANIKKVNMQLSQNAASGAQKAQFQLVFNDGSATTWLPVNRGNIEEGNLTGDIKNWGLSKSEKMDVADAAYNMFLDYDKHGTGMELEGIRYGGEDMVRELQDVLMKLMKTATPLQMQDKGDAIWIRTTYFKCVANEMQDTGYSRKEILDFLKYENCLRNGKNRAYDYQISDTKAIQKEDRKPRYYIIKKAELQKIIERGGQS